MTELLSQVAYYNSKLRLTRQRSLLHTSTRVTVAHCKRRDAGPYEADG